MNKRTPGTTKSHRRAQSQAGTALTRADGSVDRRGEDVDIAFPSETELGLSRSHSRRDGVLLTLGTLLLHLERTRSPPYTEALERPPQPRTPEEPPKEDV